MTISRADVQARIDTAVAELKRTTKGYAQGTPGVHWTTGLSELAAARSEVGQLVDPSAPSSDPVAQPAPPAFTPTRTLPAATTWAELQSALASLQPGDRVPAKGIVLPSEAVFARHLPGPAEILFDSACKASGGKGRGYPAIWVKDCVNLRLIAEGMAVTNPDAAGISIGGATGCVIDGFDVHSLGGGGIGVLPTDAQIKDTYIRSNLRDWGLDPTLDNHAEKGTGLHGLLVETTQNPYLVDGLTIVLTSLGSKVGGSLLEVGSGKSSNVPKGIVAWIHAEDLLGQTVQSDGSLGECKIQTAGNALNVYGYVAGLRVLWVYAKGLHGNAVHSDPYNNGSNYDVSIEAGYAESCCLNPRLKGQNPWQQNHVKYPNPGALSPAP